MLVFIILLIGIGLLFYKPTPLVVPPARQPPPTTPIINGKDRGKMITVKNNRFFVWGYTGDVRRVLQDSIRNSERGNWRRFGYYGYPVNAQERAWINLYRTTGQKRYLDLAVASQRHRVGLELDWEWEKYSKAKYDGDFIRWLARIGYNANYLEWDTWERNVRFFFTKYYRGQKIV